MKKLSISTLFIALALSAAAQRFEWAKGYTVSGDGYEIVGGVTDSVGNLFILGVCDASSIWEGQYITPSINKQNKSLYAQVLIAKISSEGEMEWKKLIFSNRTGAIPYDIKKIGDTAFAVMVDFEKPQLGYCYYLDTFLIGAGNFPEYPIPTVTSNGNYTALITFDFSGNVIEQHFLQVSFIDSTGNDYLSSGGNTLTEPLCKPAFDIDRHGNIYIGRLTDWDYLSEIDLEGKDGIGLKFWVDNRCAGEIYFNDEYRPDWVPQIMKFSPHFDTLLASRYVVQKSGRDYWSYWTPNIKVDTSGSLYFLYPALSMKGGDSSNVIIIDSVADIIVRHSDKSITNSYLVKFDSLLSPRWAISLDDSIWYGEQTIMKKSFHDIDFDYDSNLLFLSASVGRSSYLDTVTNSSMFTYRGTPLPLRNDACVLSFYNNDDEPVLHSCGIVPSVSSLGSTGYSKYDLLCKDNRVFFQSSYCSTVRFPRQTIRFNNKYNDGLALTVFDYSGRVIDGIDYGIESRARNYPGPIVLHDSVLYLCNLLKTSAQFGDINFPVYDETNVIAKYVDTAFMHLYVRPTHGISTVSAVAPRVYPVPATDRLHFDSPAGGVPTAVAAISLSGWRMPLTATASTADVSCLAPGVYILEITTPKDKYYTKFIKVRGER